MTCSVKVGDFNFPIEVTVVDCNGTVVPINTATSIELHILKPSAIDPKQKELLIKPASLVTDGTDGKLQYLVETGVIDIKGTYKYQAVILTAGGRLTTDFATFTVVDPLKV